MMAAQVDLENDEGMVVAKAQFYCGSSRILRMDIAIVLDNGEEVEFYGSLLPVLIAPAGFIKGEYASDDKTMKLSFEHRDGRIFFSDDSDEPGICSIALDEWSSFVRKVRLAYKTMKNEEGTLY